VKAIKNQTIRILLALLTASVLGIAAVAGSVAAQAATTLLMGTT
jgi:hypothetical protein